MIGRLASSSMAANYRRCYVGTDGETVLKSNFAMANALTAHDANTWLNK